MIAARPPWPRSFDGGEAAHNRSEHGLAEDTGSEEELSAIPDVVRGLQTVIAAVIGPEGQLKDCNRGFLMLMPRDGASVVPTDVRGLFVSPDYETLRQRPHDPFAGCAYRGPLSVAQGDGRTLSLSAVVFRLDTDLLLVAEHDFAHIAHWRTTVLDLQAELSARQQHISALQNETVRLRGMLEAAMRDRDTLLDALAAPARK